MSEQAEFESGRSSNALVGLGLLIIPVAMAYLVLFGNEDELLNAHVRRGGGLIKLIEQTLGWTLFSALLIGFGLWVLVYATVSFWKAFDGTPDVRAYDDRLEFHPAVKTAPVTYDEVSYWSLAMESGNPVLWIHLHESYWSLQGLFKRKTVKLEGDQAQLTPLLDFFVRHPIMREKLHD